MDSELTQVERHERAIGVWTHAKGSARIQHEKGGTIWSDPTENLDIAHAAATDSRQARHDPWGRLPSTSHHSFGILIASLHLVRIVAVIASQRGDVPVLQPGSERPSSAASGSGLLFHPLRPAVGRAARGTDVSVCGDRVREGGGGGTVPGDEQRLLNSKGIPCVELPITSAAAGPDPRCLVGPTSTSVPLSAEQTVEHQSPRRVPCDTRLRGPASPPADASACWSSGSLLRSCAACAAIESARCHLLAAALVSSSGSRIVATQGC